MRAVQNFRRAGPRTCRPSRTTWMTCISSKVYIRSGLRCRASSEMKA